MTDAPKSCRMRIASGLHAGVEQVLAEGEYTFGSGTAADFVLVDDGLQPLHFKVHLGAHGARIEALAEPCTVDGVGTLEAGESCDRQLPVAITVGGCRVDFAGLGAKQPGAPGPASLFGAVQRHPLLSLGGLAAMGALSSLAAQISASERPALLQPGAGVAAASSPTSDGRSAGRARTTPSSSQVAALPSPQVAAPPGAQAVAPPGNRPAAPQSTTARAKPVLPSQVASEAATAFKRDIEKAGLLNIALEPGSGVVTASGTVEPDAAGQWLALQQRFDERYMGEITVINGVTVKAEKLPVLEVQAVWRGPNPHVVIRGQKYLVGAVLDNGWAVKRIEPDRILLERQGRQLAVQY
jgi:type III secretion protein D